MILYQRKKKNPKTKRKRICQGPAQTAKQCQPVRAVPGCWLPGGRSLVPQLCDSNEVPSRVSLSANRAREEGKIPGASQLWTVTRSHRLHSAACPGDSREERPSGRQAPTPPLQHTYAPRARGGPPFPLASARSVGSLMYSAPPHK